MGRQAQQRHMRIREACWLAEEAQWMTRVIVHGRGGGRCMLTLSYSCMGRTGGGNTPVVEKAEAKREVGVNSEEVK